MELTLVVFATYSHVIDVYRERVAITGNSVRVFQIQSSLLTPQSIGAKNGTPAPNLFMPLAAPDLGEDSVSFETSLTRLRLRELR